MLNMESVTHFISEYIYVYAWMIFTTIVNIVAPLSASTVVNPVTAFFTNPQRAIGIGAFTFFVTGLQRVYLFRREILSDSTNTALIKKWLPYSIIGAFMGGLTITYINERFLGIIIIVLSSYFIAKTIYHILSERKVIKEKHPLSQLLIFMISGFLQGSGMQGADIRNNYLRTFVSEVSVRAVGSAFGLVNFFIAGGVILLRNHLTKDDVIFIFALVPFLMLAQIYGALFLRRLQDRQAKILAVILSFLGVLLLVYKYLL